MQRGSLLHLGGAAARLLAPVLARRCNRPQEVGGILGSGSGWARNFRVAIIGRPNVGKSSLFNRFCGKRMALVYDKPGVTRDSIEGTANIGELEFQVTDTAGLDDGLDMQGEDMHVEKVGTVMAASGIGRWPTHLLAKAFSRTEDVVRDAHLVLFLVDAKIGITPLDIKFARWIAKQVCVEICS